MPGFVDFQEVKSKVSFASAIDLLDLQLKKSGNQWRGFCPACETGGERALVITDQRGFYCFADKAGGDVIALAAHILNLPAKEAAQELAQRAGIVQVNSTGNNSSRERGGQRQEGSPHQGGMQPLQHLEHEHDAIVALGFDVEFCKAHGIGYATKGVVRGSIAIPFRDQQGRLLGYLGVQDLTYLPPDFQTNIVPFQKRA